MAATRARQLRDLTLADGRRLRVRCRPGRGRPLVLLHGLFDDAQGWDAPACLPSRDLMTRLRKRAFHCGPGVRAATIAIAAAGRSPRGFAHRPVAFDASGRLRRGPPRATAADEADVA